MFIWAKHYWNSEGVIDCCLTPSKQPFSHIMARTSYISMRGRLLCNEKTRLVEFLQYYLTETTVRRLMCCFTRTHYSDSEPKWHPWWYLSYSRWEWKFIEGGSWMFWIFLQGVWFKNEFIQNKSCVGWKQEVFRSNYLSKYETKLVSWKL